MARKKATRKKNASTVNKALLIKKALADDPDASPKELAARIGHGVTAQYVSTVKNSVRRKTSAKKARRTTRRKKTAATFGNLDAAIAFVEAAGSLDAAKQQIETIERIKRLQS